MSTIGGMSTDQHDFGPIVDLFTRLTSLCPLSTIPMDLRNTLNSCNSVDARHIAQPTMSLDYDYLPNHLCPSDHYTYTTMGSQCALDL
jgi:hypothetical protein